MVVFLSDGEASSGETNSDAILANIKNLNVNDVSIYSLAFGEGADFELVRDIARSSFGTERKILERDDAVEQMSSYWKEISTPLMKDLKVTYTALDVQRRALSIQKINVYPDITERVPYLFSGSEMLYAGVLPEGTNLVSVAVTGKISKDSKIATRRFEIPYISIEELFGHQRDVPIVKTWAMLALSDMEERKGEPGVDELATDIALKQGFVTPWTSMVIVTEETPQDDEIEESDSEEPEDLVLLYEEPDEIDWRSSGRMSMGNQYYARQAGLAPWPRSAMYDTMVYPADYDSYGDYDYDQALYAPSYSMMEGEDTIMDMTSMYAGTAPPPGGRASYAAPFPQAMSPDRAPEDEAYIEFGDAAGRPSTSVGLIIAAIALGVLLIAVCICWKRKQKPAGVPVFSQVTDNIELVSVDQVVESSVELEPTASSSIERQQLTAETPRLDDLSPPTELD